MTAPLSLVSFLIPVWSSHDILEAEDYSVGRNDAEFIQRIFGVDPL